MRNWPASVFIVLTFLIVACFESEPQFASFAPSGWLAVVRDGELHIVNPDDARPAAQSPVPVDGSVAWSPNGVRVAFISGGEIWVSRTDAAPERRTNFGSVGASATSLIWTPDNARIIYTLDGASPLAGTFDLMSGQHHVIADVPGQLAGWWNARGLLTPTLLMYHAETASVFLLETDSGEQRPLLTGSSPVPNPLDARILYIDGGNLYLRTSTGQFTAVAADFDTITEARWSPDGRRIAIANGSGGPRTAGIWILTPDGASPAYLGPGANPSWSRDTRVAVERGGQTMILEIGAGEVSRTLAGIRPSWQPPNPPAETEDASLPRGLVVERAFPNIEIYGLLDLVYLPGADRFFALDKTGRIFTFPNNAASADPELFLDLRDKVFSEVESGLLSLVFDPDFESNGYFYVFYSAGGADLEGPRRSVLSRFEAQIGKFGVVGRDTEVVVLEIPMRYDDADMHAAGQLRFGSDDYLYVSVGDGGDRKPELFTSPSAQNLSNLLGSIVRIDVRSEEGAGYTVPADNPFVNVPEAAGEIWAFGLRNPWRFSIDSVTGQLWAGDVGASISEEINIIQRGANYGWSHREGTDRTHDDPSKSAQFQPPIYNYPHPEVGCSAIIGGYVYRGEAIDGLRGAYLFGDFCSPGIRALTITNGEASKPADVVDASSWPVGQGAGLASIVEGPGGEPYLVILSSGTIWKISPARDQATTAPTVTPTATRAPSEGVGTRRVQGVPVADFFANNCAGCHGAEREGIAGLGAPLLPDLLIGSDDFYSDTIRLGRAGTVMPAWGEQGLVNEDIRALVDFIRSSP